MENSEGITIEEVKKLKKEAEEEVKGIIQKFAEKISASAILIEDVKVEVKRYRSSPFEIITEKKPAIRTIVTAKIKMTV